MAISFSFVLAVELRPYRIFLCSDCAWSVAMWPCPTGAMLFASAALLNVLFNKNMECFTNLWTVPYFC